MLTTPDAPGVSRDDVIAAYELILGRTPSEDEVEVHLVQPSRLVMGYAFLRTEEARARLDGPVPDLMPPWFQVFRGYAPGDEALLRRIVPNPAMAGTPGFITDFLGRRTRTSFEPSGEPLDGTVWGYPVPACWHAEAPEWLGLARAVLEARGSLSVMELGAGYGPWLVSAAVAARLNGITDLRLVGVEADAGRFARLRQHFLDNDLDPDAHTLIEAAVSDEAGTAYWPAEADPQDSGMRASRDPDAGLRPVRMVALGELLAPAPRWDLLHVDIQGAEAQVLAGTRDALQERVRRIVIGTHSRVIEGELMRLFLDLGWQLEHEKPAMMSPAALRHGLVEATIQDGIQVWSNPALV